MKADPSVVRGIVDTRAASITLDVPRPEGGVETLELHRTSIVDMHSRVEVVSEDGSLVAPLLPRMVTYRTSLPDGGFAVFTLDRSGSVSGMLVRLDERIVVSPQRGITQPGTVVVTHAPVQSYTCGTYTEQMSADLERVMRQVADKALDEMPQALDTIEMKIAVEADYQFSKGFASSDEAMNYIGQLFALASAIYERDLGVRMVLSNVRIWEASSDPYPDNIGVFTGLDQVFVNEYRTNMTSVDRDVAVLLTMRGAGGGLAVSIGGICEDDGSYACADVNGDLTTNADGYAWDFSMVAHEIGHVCGGLHTQSCIWPTGPLDSCVASEDGECVTWDMTRPALGTIMSYCHNRIIDGARMINAFHPLSRNVISSYIRSAPCMGGTAPERTARLTGIVRDEETGAPLSGIRLHLGRYIDKIVRQVPAVDGDTVVTTAADGSYTFEGLGYGIYTVAFEDGWVPAVVDNLPFQNSVSVADTLTRFDLRAARGQRFVFDISTTLSYRVYNLAVYSEQLPNFMTTVASPYYILPLNDSTFRYITYLPDGDYVIVPYAVQTVFEPKRISVRADHTLPSASHKFKAATTGQSNQTTIAMGVVEIPPEASTSTPRFVGGMPYRIRNTDLNLEFGAGTVPDDGVIVVDRVLTNYAYAIVIDIDTSTYVPRSFEARPTLAPRWQYNAGIFSIQERRRPLIARAYTASVEQRAYHALVNPTILASSTMGSALAPMSMMMPFPLQILDREFDELQISQNGFIAFGSMPLDPWTEHPFEYPMVSSLAIGALTGSLFPGDLYPDTNAAKPWSIAYEVSGTAPDRTLHLEWRNVSAFTFDMSANDVAYVGPFTFQVQVHENGAIDMQYQRPANVQVPMQTRIGLRGNDLLDHQVIRCGTLMSDATAEFDLDGTTIIDISTPDQFTDGLTYHWEIAPTVSVQDHAVSHLRLQPSVAQSTVEVIGLREPTLARIVDLFGTVLRTVQLTGAPYRINVHDLAPGRYALVCTENSIPVVLPFIVLR